MKKQMTRLKLKTNVFGHTYCGSYTGSKSFLWHTLANNLIKKSILFHFNLCLQVSAWVSGTVLHKWESPPVDFNNANINDGWGSVVNVTDPLLTHISICWEVSLCQPDLCSSNKTVLLILGMRRTLVTQHTTGPTFPHINRARNEIQS